jgi:hypothetical protein
MAIKSLIPVAQLSAESLESLHSEMKASIFHLLKEEPTGLVENLRSKWEDWVNR